MTNANKVSNFTPDSLEGKFLAKTNTNKTKDVAVTLNKTRFEKQHVPTFKSNENSWGKSLVNLLSFTIKEIEQHRLNSGKTPDSAIIKALDKGRKFKCNVIYLLILYTESGKMNIFMLNVNAKQARKKRRGESQ